MGILGTIGSVASGVFTGGATSIFGVGFGILGSYFKNKHDLEVHKLALDEMKLKNEQEIALLDKHAQIAEKQLNMKLNSEQFIEDKKAMSEASKSQDSDISWGKEVIQRANSFWIDFLAIGLGFTTFIQKLTRPTLTGAYTWMTYDMWSRIGGTDIIESLPADDKFKIVMQISGMILFLASTAGSFWFLTRPTKPRETN